MFFKTMEKKKYKQKNDFIDLARNTLNSVQKLISKPMRDSDISQHNCLRLKENIRTKTVN